MKGGDVVYLAFDNPNLERDELSMTACKFCRNKTFKIIHDKHEYPKLQCAACGNHISRLGWVHED